jgi:hypothetical protein
MVVASPPSGGLEPLTSVLELMCQFIDVSIKISYAGVHEVQYFSLKNAPSYT